ncbi:uncharacterized protein VTP21DRAFT_209 [Calcarisporiella thermophila]|uniref:uncharacterized protein n=1 Tax=Calcarisporiella thermophila TaxID=911321 RepID=UPI0037421D59
MEFRKCTINGVKYGYGTPEAAFGAQKRELAEKNSHKPAEVQHDMEVQRKREEAARLQLSRKQMRREMSMVFKNKYAAKKMGFVAPGLFGDVAQGGAQKEKVVEFFTALALCHTVLCEKPDPDNPHHIIYKAQSPDEAALVQTAKECGFAYLGQEHGEVRVDILGEQKVYRLLQVLEFSSTRKRVSVVVRNPEGRLMLICKGADSIVYERLAKPGKKDPTEEERRLEGEQRRVQKITSKHLENFADEGLRTLCVAYRYLDEHEYELWSERYRIASTSLVNREEEVEAAADQIERELLLLGGTAIEDHLQEGVPETIDLLIRASIKIWVLTGDKMETAINIGYAANLLQKGMQLVIIRGDSREEVLRKLEEALATHWPPDGVIVPPTGLPDDEKTETKHALVIDGESLKYALEKGVREKLLELGKRCASVICCRVSPLQKAKVVRLVKHGLNAMTLSIGDGANDVSMIQEANVGVGISGEEGRQAVMASDYAIAQFRYLGKLLLVHGRWSYARTSSMILMFFYKNVIWTFTLFWYQFYCSFSGQMFIDYTLVLLYNLIFTSLPCIFLGVFDQDLNARISKATPQLYTRGIYQLNFTSLQFWTYMLDALYQSVVVYFVPYILLIGGNLTPSGNDANGMFDFGTVVGGCVVTVANAFVFTCLHSFTGMMVAVVVGSILSFFAWVGIFGWLDGSFMHRQDAIVFAQAGFWLVLVLTVVASLLPRLAVQYYLRMYRPTDVDIVREAKYLRRKANKKQQRREKKMKKEMRGGESMETVLPREASEAGETLEMAEMHMDDDDESVVTETRPEEADEHGLGEEKDRVVRERRRLEEAVEDGSDYFSYAPSPIPSPTTIDREKDMASRVQP